MDAWDRLTGLGVSGRGEKSFTKDLICIATDNIVLKAWGRAGTG